MVQKVMSTITGTMAQIITTIVNEDFCRSSAEHAGGKFISLDVSGNTDDDFTVTTQGLVPSSMLPEIAKKFLSSDIPLEYKQHWKAPAADGSRSAEVTISVKNGLVSVTGTQIFTPAPDGSPVVNSVFTGEAKANIPLIGGKVAAMIEPKFAQAVEMQANTIADWVAQHPSMCD